jgi:hypothetical protein
MMGPPRNRLFQRLAFETLYRDEAPSLMLPDLPREDFTSSKWPPA